MSKVVGIFSREENSIELLVSNHYMALYKVACRYACNTTAAQDLLQDTFLYALEKREKVMGMENPFPWLMQCLYHRFIDQFRKEKAYLYESYDSNLDEFVKEPASQEDIYLIQQLSRALQTLSPKQRVAVILFDVEGYTLKEIVGFMDAPEATVKSYIRRGRAALRERLKTKTLLASDDMMARRKNTCCAD